MKIISSLIICLFSFGIAKASQKGLDNYNIVWNSPSANSLESMPCGGGDIGMNVWVEDGDLLIYISRSGTFDELNSFPKLGRIRITMSPNPLENPDHFHQELKLKEGYVEIKARKNGTETTINIIQFLISMSQVMFPPNSMLLMKDGDLKKEYSQSLRQKSAELT